MHEYYIFHKPYQVLSQFSAEGDKKTLFDYFPNIQKNIYPVGRLDYDSEGLLLLTNDRSLTHTLLDPSFAHPRTYWVQVEGLISEKAIAQLQNGLNISIDGKTYATRKTKAILLAGQPQIADRVPPIRFRKNIPVSWIALTLTEGKNRQVRRMTAAAGYPTLRLIRCSIGRLTIAGLNSGEYTAMNDDVKKLVLG